jgi:hypothetical protein
MPGKQAIRGRMHSGRSERAKIVPRRQWLNATHARKVATGCAGEHIVSKVTAASYGIEWPDSGHRVDIANRRE